MTRMYLATCDFNHKTYGNYEDLRLMTDQELEDHFFNYGIAEGRFYNKIQSRKDFLNSIDSNGKMLEIGPLDNPQLDHNSCNYYSIDVFTKEQLKKNYENDPNVNKEKIIEPSYIISNNDYSQIKEKFKCIFSSHNIEHMPCVVTFLNNLHGLLSDDGFIYLIVPDKRYCFDHFKKETDIYDVLQSYYEKNYRPRFMDVLKTVSQFTHNNAIDHWDNKHGAVGGRKDLVSSYAPILGQYNTGNYIDSHVSFFTPHTFMEIIDILNELKLIQLEIHKLYHTLRYNLEFYVILKKRQIK